MDSFQLGALGNSKSVQSSRCCWVELCVCDVLLPGVALLLKFLQAHLAGSPAGVACLLSMPILNEELQPLGPLLLGQPVRVLFVAGAAESD